MHQLTFTGQVGQRPVLQFSDRSLSTAARLIDPNGVTVVRGYESDPVFTEFEPLPAAGTWTIEFDPQTSQVGSLAVRLDLVTAW